MEQLTISGFGFDLAEALYQANLTLEEKQLYDTVIHSDAFDDTVDEFFKITSGRLAGISVVQPINTDDFVCFINIPDISPVYDDADSKPMIYTRTQAVDKLANFFQTFFSTIVDNYYLDHPADEIPTDLVASIVSKINAQIPSLAAHEQFQDGC